MGTATTIVFAREDLTIPGAAEAEASNRDRPETAQTRFFDLISQSSPDVIVLDLSRAPVGGTDTILTVRRRTEIPILVVCNAGQLQMEDYRIAGAADCITAPVDIVNLNQAIQRIVRIRGAGNTASVKIHENFLFAGINFCPRRNVLAGSTDLPVDLTSSEARLLTHFVSRPWTLCTRGEIAELLYGSGHLVGDRAIDVVVNRLRKKLVLAGGIDAEQLIKTEFRRGYLMVADVARVPHQPSVRAGAAPGQRYS